MTTQVAGRATQQLPSMTRSMLWTNASVTLWFSLGHWLLDALTALQDIRNREYFTSADVDAARDEVELIRQRAETFGATQAADELEALTPSLQTKAPVLLVMLMRLLPVKLVDELR